MARNLPEFKAVQKWLDTAGGSELKLTIEKIATDLKIPSLTPMNQKAASSYPTPDYKSLPPSVISARRDRLTANLTKSVR